MVTSERDTLLPQAERSSPVLSLGILESVEPFRTSSLRSDIERICRFFGTGPTSALMVRLTGCTKAVLSRAQSENGSESIRGAEHIAVLAALAIEMERVGPGFADPATMKRWLFAGKLITPNGPMRPLDALADAKLALAALHDVRSARLRQANPEQTQADRDHL